MVARLTDLGGPGHVLNGVIFARGRCLRAPCKGSPAGREGTLAGLLGPWGTSDGEGRPITVSALSPQAENNPFLEHKLFVMNKRSPGAGGRAGLFQICNVAARRPHRMHGQVQRFAP